MRLRFAIYWRSVTQSRIVKPVRTVLLSDRNSKLHFIKQKLRYVKTPWFMLGDWNCGLWAISRSHPWGKYALVSSAGLSNVPDLYDLKTLVRHLG